MQELAGTTGRLAAGRERNLGEQTRMGILCLLPTLLFLAVFVVFPVVFSLYLSFTSWDMVSPTKPWVGLANYQGLLQDPDVRASIFATIYFALGFVLGVTVLALALALLVDAKLRGIELFRAIFYLPAVVSAVAISVVWVWLYEPTYGLFNAALAAVGLPTSQWLSDPNMAMPGVIIMMVWKTAGYFMVIYLAGLKGIPTILYEAASMDGASWLASFRFVTLPLLAPVTFFIVVMATIQSFQVFGPIYVMTSGGPVNATMVVAYYLYVQAFQYFRMGYASALAYVLFGVILVLTLLQMRYFGRGVSM